MLTPNLEAIRDISAEKSAEYSPFSFSPNGELVSEFPLSTLSWLNEVGLVFPSTPDILKREEFISLDIAAFLACTLN